MDDLEAIKYFSARWVYRNGHLSKPKKFDNWISWWEHMHNDNYADYIKAQSEKKSLSENQPAFRQGGSVADSK